MSSPSNYSDLHVSPSFPTRRSSDLDVAQRHHHRAGEGRGVQHRGGLEFAHVRQRKFKPDRKSTRLNSSHTVISYAAFCLKKKKHRMRKSERTQGRAPARGSDRQSAT